MRKLSVIAIIIMLLAGCATFQRSEVIDTDKFEGYASGTYRDDSAGPSGTVVLGGSGAGWGGGGGGLGMGCLGITTGPPDSNSYKFAKAIAMINYSKKLKNIKYDETGGIIQYEFEHKPLTSTRGDYQPPAAKPKLPSSFGYQPIE